MKIIIEQEGKPTVTYDYQTCCNSECPKVPSGYIVMALCEEHMAEIAEKLCYTFVATTTDN